MEQKYKAKIRFGLSGINNVAGASMESIMGNRPYKTYADFINKVDTSKVNRRVQKHLIQAGCFDSFLVNRHQLLAGYLDIEPKKSKDGEKQLTLFGTDANIDYKFPRREPPTMLEKIRMEEEAMGISASGNIRDLYPESKQYKVPENIIDGQIITSFFIITDIKKVLTKKDGKEMAFIILEDERGKYEAVVFSRLWDEKFKNIVLGNGLLVMMRYQEERNSYLVNDVQKLEAMDNAAN